MKPLSIIPKQKQFEKWTLPSQYTVVGVWLSIGFFIISYIFPSSSSNTTGLYFIGILLFLFSTYLIFSFYKTIFKETENRKAYLSKLKHEIWENKYIEAINSLINKLDYIEERKSFIFSLISLSYTYLVFNFSWVVGSSGRLFSLEIFPQIDTYIARFTITVFILLITWIIYKISFKLNKLDKSYFSLMLALIVSYFWWISTNNIYISVLWFIVTYLSPTLSIFSGLLIVLDENFEITFLKPFILLSMASTFIYAIFSYLRIDNKRKIWLIFRVETYNNPILILFSLLLHLGITITFYSFLENYELLGYVLSNIISIILLFIFYFIIRDFFYPISILLSVLLPAIIVVVGIYYSLEETLFVKTGCYFVDKEVVGFFALIILIPIINSIFDYLSYVISKLLLIHLSMINPKKTNWFLSKVFLHILADVVLAVLLLLSLATSLLFILDNYFSFITSESCEVMDLTTFVTAVKNTPLTLDTTWVMVLLFTTLVPTMIHTVAAVLSLIRNIVSRDVRVITKSGV